MQIGDPSNCALNFYSGISMTWKTVSLALTTIASVGAINSSVAQNTTLYTEYDKTITAAKTIQAYDDSLFGEQINLYTGSTEFAVTDVSLAGNSALPVRIGRRYQVEDKLGVYGGQVTPRLTRQFGDWRLDIPYLSGVFARTTGWVSSYAPDGSRRCSITITDPAAAQPPMTSDTQTGSTWFAAGEYWHGNFLHMPGGGDQEMMIVNPSNSTKPSSGGPYHWITKDQWFFSCTTTTANGIAGEAFIATAPDGTQYKFNWFVSWPEKRVDKPHGMQPVDPVATVGGASSTSTPGNTTPLDSTGEPPESEMQAAGAYLHRSEVNIYPTEVKDRFGNKVIYTYDQVKKDRLLKIEGFTASGASDGRRIDISYDDTTELIDKISAGTQEWDYNYVDGRLTEVVMPDNSKWQLAMGGLSNVHIAAELAEPACWGAPMDANQSTYSGTITHPSGAIGTFAFKPTLHSRSSMPPDSENCMMVPYWNGVESETKFYSVYPPMFAAVSIQDKTISGPALSTMQWHYSYSAAVDCTSTCPPTKSTVVTGPDKWERHTFSNRFHDAEGMVEKVETGTSATNILRTRVSSYLTNPAGQAFADRVGVSPFPRGDHASERHAPVYLNQLLQEGGSFTWRVSDDCLVNGQATYCFDQFARPTKVTKSSALTP